MTNAKTRAYLYEYRLIREELYRAIRYRNNLVTLATSIAISSYTLVISISNFLIMGYVLAIVPLVFAILYLLYMSNSVRIKIIYNALKNLIDKIYIQFNQIDALKSDLSISKKTIEDKIMRSIWIVIMSSSLMFAYLGIDLMFRTMGFNAVASTLIIYCATLMFIIFMRKKYLSTE